MMLNTVEPYHTIPCLPEEVGCLADRMLTMTTTRVRLIKSRSSPIIAMSIASKLGDSELFDSKLSDRKCEEKHEV